MDLFGKVNLELRPHINFGMYFMPSFYKTGLENVYFGHLLNAIRLQGGNY